MFYSIVERLLSVHGVDPNCPYTRPNDPYRYPLEENEPSTRPPLWMIMCAVDDFCAEFEDFDNGGDPDAREPMFRPFMRTVDLLVRHGARSSAADSDARSGELGPSEYYDYMNAWICTRADCTPQVLEATRRGNLAFDWPRNLT